MSNFKAKVNLSDLVFLFEPIEASQIQQMLISLKYGYELKSISSFKGVVQFVFSKGDKK